MRMLMLLILLGSLMVACAPENEENLKKAIDVGKSYKTDTYTIKHDEIPEKKAERMEYLKEKAAPYASKELLESDLLDRIMGRPYIAALARQADIAVKDITLGRQGGNSGSEEEIKLVYEITIEVTKENEVVDELTFDGKMTVVNIDGEWQVTKDSDNVPADIMHG
ncbi:hypothetical protein ACFO3D_14665 [Virgibacillus kekensis]|uniref:Lipoprotein n=1 Tax=Virgibacillus kekensis TaxID=202261 RepID=A0ABV9DPE1_9BACI